MPASFSQSRKAVLLFLFVLASVAFALCWFFSDRLRAIPDVPLKLADDRSLAPVVKSSDIQVDEEFVNRLKRPAPSFTAPRKPTQEEAASFEAVFRGKDTQGRDLYAADMILWDTPRYHIERARAWRVPREGAIPTPDDRIGWDDGTDRYPEEKHIPKDERWRSVRILRVSYSDDRREALIAVRLVPIYGPPRTARYKLILADGGWQAYDRADDYPWVWHSNIGVVATDLTDDLMPTADRDPRRTPRTNEERAERLATLRHRVSDSERFTLPPNLAAFRHFYVGQADLFQDDPAAALKSFEAAVAADPTWPTAHTGRAQAFVEIGRIREAFRSARAAADWIGAE